jgi:hypothetical protein
MLPAVAAALLGSAVGAWAVTQVDPGGLKKGLPVLLALVLAYTLMRKDLGQDHLPRWTGSSQAAVAAAIGLVVGFYDGVFGPGTGSFFVFALVRLLGWDFLHASAGAKLLNQRLCPDPVRRQWSCVVAGGCGVGAGEHGRESAGDAAGAQARVGTHPAFLHRRGVLADSEDGLRCLAGLKEKSHERT